MKQILFCILLLNLGACHNHKEGTQDHHDKLEKSNSKSVDASISKADKVLNRAFKAHGGQKYEQAKYSFTFRNKDYNFENNGTNFKYEVKSNKGDTTIHDILEDGKFTRTLNGNPEKLSSKEENNYRNSLNSVLYFATLPHKLNDKAVKKQYKGKAKIKSKEYEVLKITFNEEGGGVDHDDIFYYWIGSDDHQIDYLAYSYHVNKGGVRFRTAFNKRTVDGIIFQDYVNYKAEIGTPLEDLPILWEQSKLKKLSEILTENVQAL